MISLCMIAGNEEDNIVRCLDSAGAAFDELCLVRAIGDQQADRTEANAAGWCDRHGKAFKFSDYTNRIPFPHVDDFAAARNLSFGMASEPWLMWLDCDDQVEEPEHFRQAVTKPEVESFNGLFCPYYWQPQAWIPRERLIRNGKGRWAKPIHETCLIDGPVCTVTNLRVKHSPTKKPRVSSERNLRILEHHLVDIERQLFYLHEEQFGCGKKEQAIKSGKAALQMLDDCKLDERYEILLNLAELEPEHAWPMLTQAATLQPHRREAIAYLSQTALREGRVSDAVSYFRMMDALPRPEPLPWTHRETWYGGAARNLLRIRLLKACGRIAEAQQDHERYMQEDDYQRLFERFPITL